MKKMFKILGTIFIIFFVLIIIALILARIFITPEKVRALIVDQLAKNLNREVEIQDLSVSIFKGVSVEGFKVSESPAFKEGTFISSKKFLVRYKLLPLLKKQLSISTVILEEPYLNIIRKSDGSFNFSDLLKPTTADQEKEQLPTEKKQPPKTPAFGFLVSRAKLKDGEINFVDYSPEAMSLKVHNVNLDVSGISLVSPMDIRCSAGLEHKETTGNLSFNGELDLDKGILRIEELSPSYHDMSLTIKGYVKDLKEKPKLDISLQDKKINIKDISKILPMPEDIELQGSPRFKIDISGPMDNILIKTDANMEDISVKYQNTFEKKIGEKSGFNLEVELKENEILKLNQSSVYLEDFNISASGQIKGLKTLPITLDITIQTKESDLKDLAKFLPVTKDSNLSGKLAAVFDILLPLTPPKEEGKEGSATPKLSSSPSMVDDIIKGITVDGTLKIDQIIYQDFKLSKADAKINMRQGKLEIKPLSIEGYEGKLSGGLQADLKRIDDVQFNTTINLKNLNFNPAITDLHPQRIAKIYGKASFESIIFGKSSKIPDSLEGSGYLKIGNGKIESAMPLMGQFMALLGKPQPEAVFFSELKGHYKLKDKKIITEDLQMIGDDVSFDAQGWADLDKNLHFDVTARLNEKMLGKGIRKHIVRDNQGRSLLFLIVKGNMNKPDIHPNVKKTLAEQAKQKAKDSILEKVLDEKDGELRKTIEKGLDQLFKFKK